MAEITNMTLYENIRYLADLPIADLRRYASDDEHPSRTSLQSEGLAGKTRGELIEIILDRDHPETDEGDGWQGIDTRPAETDTD